MAPLFFVLLTAGTLPAQAAYDYKFDSKPYPMGNFESEMSGKASRGLTNILFGWTEMFRTPVQLNHGIEHGLAYSLIVGIPYGILRAGARTVVGVYEILTFYAPQGPIMEPIEGDVL